jgi:hypothetical protein
MTVTAAPATPRLMALARCIGGAVRGFGRKVLAKIAGVELSAAAATPGAGMLLEMMHRMQVSMVDCGMDTPDDAAAEQWPEHGPALEARLEKLADMLEAIFGKPEDEDEDSEDDSDASLWLFVRHETMYRRLNWALPGFGMIPLWRNRLPLTSKIFQRRICGFGRLAS